MKFKELERIFSPLFWGEKGVEYAIQDMIEPSKEAKIKMIGYGIIIKKSLRLLGVPYIYEYCKNINPEAKEKTKENIRNSLLQKGYTLNQLPF